ncbi:hypothetical protein GDO81_013627 [Engystomops pustulosus]|uniref:Secreted protein n=1 Tax=Engystomops pustulosus TaxID=76066 RepID=A0AAV7B4P0_ENGPU|nr:hypothetical protein GDO81_013627 [Engystomops pustulosus]
MHLLLCHVSCWDVYLFCALSPFTKKNHWNYLPTTVILSKYNQFNFFLFVLLLFFLTHSTHTHAFHWSSANNSVFKRSIPGG